MEIAIIGIPFGGYFLFVLVKLATYSRWIALEYLNSGRMENEDYMHSGLSADKSELQRTLNNLRTQEASLKNQIKDIKGNGISHFNSLEYYEESLRNVKGLITNLKFHIKSKEI